MSRRDTYAIIPSPRTGYPLGAGVQANVGSIFVIPACRNPASLILRLFDISYCVKVSQEQCGNMAFKNQNRAMEDNLIVPPVLETKDKATGFRQAGMTTLIEGTDRGWNGWNGSGGMMLQLSRHARIFACICHHFRGNVRILIGCFRSLWSIFVTPDRVPPGCRGPRFCFCTATPLDSGKPE